MLDYLSDIGVLPADQYTIVEEGTPTAPTTEFPGLPIEAFLEETPEARGRALENVSGFIEEWKAKSNTPEKWVGLEEYFEWLNERQYDKEPENIRLVFSWDLIQQLIELFDSLMPPIDSVSDPDAGIVANPDRFPDWFAGGKAIVFDPDKISLTDLFESTAAGTLVGGLNEPAAPRGQETARVYDLNDITLVEALAS